MFENITFNGSPLTFSICHKALWSAFHEEFGSSPDALANGHSVREWLCGYDRTCWEEDSLAAEWGVEMAN